MKILLKAENLSLARGTQYILKHIQLVLTEGEGLHLIGENGSGKTTLLQALAGLLPPQSGKIERHAPLLYLGHKAGIKAHLTVEENLMTAALLYHQIPFAKAKPLVTKALQYMEIEHLKNRETRQLSAGQTRRVQLARLWLPNTKIWLLDEPFTALDVKTISILKEKLTEHLQKNGVILLSSHQSVGLTAIQEIDIKNLSHKKLSTTIQKNEDFFESL